MCPKFRGELDRICLVLPLEFSLSDSAYDFAYAKVQKSIFKPKIVFVQNIDIILNAF